MPQPMCGPFSTTTDLRSAASSAGVYFHFGSRFSFYYAYRNLHATNTRHGLSTFSKGTATGTLRRHLIDRHLREWVSGCDQLGIEITAKSAQVPVHEYRHGNPPASVSNDRKPYSKEAFMDAIVAFIVSDDQVCDLQSHCTFGITVHSPSMLSNHDNCKPFS
jgi:hypothetical protein